MLAMRRFHLAGLSRRLYLTHLFQLPHLIRFRLTLWYTGLAALVLAVFVGGVFYEFKQYQFDSVNDDFTTLLRSTFKQDLDRQISLIVRSLPPYVTAAERDQILKNTLPSSIRLTDPDAAGKGYTPIVFVKTDGTPLTKTSARTPLDSKVAKDGRSSVTKAAQHNKHDTAPDVRDVGSWRIITVPLSVGDQSDVVGQIAVPMWHIEQRVDALKHILVYIAGVLLLISAAGGWILSGRALQPIDEITRRARQITANDLSQRLDVTQEDELGRMAATFDDMIARLEDAFERQKRFASDASHELRTPLTVMQSEVGLALARPRSAEEYRETLMSMDEEVSRLSTIVSDLLTLTRIDVDPAGIQHEPVALDELLRELVARVNVIALERDITVYAESLAPVTVTGDPTRLRQLFTNLLDNAVNYTPEGGRVTVTLERIGEGARVRVADTGIGIASQDLPRIFERFYRADAARAQNAEGTGLGLALSRSVVQAHHGHIDVVSQPDRGTTFTVTLPIDSLKPIRRLSPRRVPALAR